MTIRRSFIFFLAFFLSGLLFIGCRNDNAGSETVSNSEAVRFNMTDMKKMIQKKNNQFTEAHVKGDHAAIDTMFTLDARSFPPHAKPVIGGAAIAALTKAYIEYGVSQFNEETVNLYGSGDLLIDQGNYSMTYGPENIVEHGNYIQCMEKSGRAVENIFQYVEYE